MDNSLYKGAHHWTKERLLEEIVKGRLTLSPVGTYCIVPDGKRLSNPGLDIVVCWLWREPSGSAMWAPPQVPQGAEESRTIEATPSAHCLGTPPLKFARTAAVFQRTLPVGISRGTATDEHFSSNI